MASRTARVQLPTSGAFHSVPGAFPTAGASLAHAIKLEFVAEPVHQEDRCVRIESRVLADRVLVDFGAIGPMDLNIATLVRDCQLIIDLARTHPKALRGIFRKLGSLNPGDVEGIRRIAAKLRKIGFTEEVATASGGGFLILILLAAGALFAAGCAHAAPGGVAHGKPTTPRK